MPPSSWTCERCDVLVTDMNRRQHYQDVHTTWCLVRLPGFNTNPTRIDRSPRTMKFNCPRVGCTASFKAGPFLQEHVDACFRTVSGTSSRKLGSPLRTNLSAERVGSLRRSSRHGYHDVSRQLHASSAYRSPRVPYRLPKSTHTQRALIRQCFRQGNKMVSEIAEYVGCDASTVWFAVHNECSDNLAEDQAYINGETGDVVDIATLAESELDVKMEEMEAEEVDTKLNAVGLLEEDEAFFDTDDHEDHDGTPTRPSLSPSRQLNVYDGRSVSRASSLSSLTSLGEDQGAAWNAVPQAGPSGRPAYENPDVHRFAMAIPGPSESFTPNSSLNRTAREPSPIQPSSTSSTLNASPAARQSKDVACAVAAFLNDLESPCGHLLPYFYEMEIDSEENLDHLCRIDEEMWNEVKTYPSGKNHIGTWQTYHL